MLLGECPGAVRDVLSPLRAAQHEYGDPGVQGLPVLLELGTAAGNSISGCSLASLGISSLLKSSSASIPLCFPCTGRGWPA